jgi:hypothetical protein
MRSVYTLLYAYSRIKLKESHYLSSHYSSAIIGLVGCFIFLIPTNLVCSLFDIKLMAFKPYALVIFMVPWIISVIIMPRIFEVDDYSAYTFSKFFGLKMWLLLMIIAAFCITVSLGMYVIF